MRMLLFLAMKTQLLHGLKMKSKRRPSSLNSYLCLNLPLPSIIYAITDLIGL